MKTTKTDNIILTEAQQNIFDCVTNKIKNHRGRYDCVIRGYAGTGKSTTVSRIIDYCISNGENVAVTSPTHKANKVIRDMISKHAKVQTIHSFLGLELKQVKEEQILVPVKNFVPPLVDVLIIDECSMISFDMYMHIVNRLSCVRRCVIFVGDDCQLPPIEKDAEALGTSKLSKSFTHGEQHQLTEVLRQAEKNTIIQLATSVRKCVHSNTNPLPLIKGIAHDNENVLRINDKDTFFYSYVQTLSEEKDLDAAIDKFKLICFLNRDVDYYNALTRDILLDNPADEFIVGENIIVQSVNENTILKTQEMIKVNDTLKRTTMFGVELWEMHVSNDQGSNIIRFTGPTSKRNIDFLLRTVVNGIHMKDINPKTKQPYNWSDYYLIKKSIIEMSYPYALTYYKSQGSTYDTAWMSLNYVNSLTNYKDMARMLYTAITRPRTALVILD